MSINGIEYNKWTSPTSLHTLLRVPVAPNRAIPVCEFRIDLELGPEHEKNIIRAVELHDELVDMIQALLDWAPGTHNSLTDRARALLKRVKS